MPEASSNDEVDFRGRKIAVRVMLERTRIGTNGPKYRATLNGDVLVDDSRDPEHDAARALVARGIKGRMVTRWKGATYDAMTLDIERAATRCTIESERHGPRTKRWEPRPTDLYLTDMRFPVTGESNERCLEVFGVEGCLKPPTPINRLHPIARRRSCPGA